MELYVYNNQFEYLGDIDIYDSFTHERNLYKPGKFKLELDFDTNVFQLLQEDNILIKKDNLKEACYIAYHNLDTQGNNDKLIVQGFSIENLLRRRIVWGQQRYKGDIDAVMKAFVEHNAIHPADPKRKLPNLVLSPAKTFGLQTEEVCSYKYLPDISEQLAMKHEIGWRLLFDIKNKCFVYDIWRGKNLSTQQNLVDPVIFSLDNENVLNQTYVRDNGNYANMALVAGAGEGKDRKLETINNNIGGWNRRELFVDARDISDKGENDQIINAAEYSTLLTERGKNKLTEVQTVEAFEMDIIGDEDSQYVYRKDYDLGDRVTADSKRWGIRMHPLITSITEVYQNNLLDVRVEFGTNLPTQTDILKRKFG